MNPTPALLASADQSLYPNYAKPGVIIDRGLGARLWDTEGRSYLDFYAGVAVSVLGHSHPALVSAIQRQAEKVIHVANYFHNEPSIHLAEKLKRLTKMDRVFFCNSGTEANEALLKLARRHFFNAGQPERSRIIAFDNSFHGRTLGALAATGQKKYREGFGPMGGVTHVPYGDLAAVRAAFGPDVAGVLVETIQGEGGVVVGSREFLAGLRQLCDEHGALLLTDEIQTGIGRTGRFLGLEHSGVEADATSLAKALGGGFPIGAMACKPHLSQVLVPGTHGTTYGGGPLACAAALATVEVVEREELAARAERLGQTVAERLQRLSERSSVVVGHRGQGLLRAIVLADGTDPATWITRLREAGVLVVPAGASTLRIMPPLTISEADLDEGLTLVERTFGEFS
ncbi:MAG TPA: acetylornithine/succinylornithine family transaminase [Polyangiaceae bacterium]|nr:acetylornithine/succinylornithine family transaminase [Polyangiaceae bacterium]